MCVENLPDYLVVVHTEANVNARYVKRPDAACLVAIAVCVKNVARVFRDEFVWFMNWADWNVSLESE
jgi:hypothetical protein